MSGVPNSHILILCPMQIEHRHVQRALRRRQHTHNNLSLIQTGIGKAAILCSLHAHLTPKPALIILAGACGGLSHVSDVPPIARIIDEHGNSWTPRGSRGASPSEGVTLIAVDRIISSPADKLALAKHTGASIVDMESHAFAAACDELGIPYAIVRGVSDTPDETLPAELLSWISPNGDTLAHRAAFDLIRKPRLVPHIISVVRRSNRVLPKVGHAVADLVHNFRSS